jgi:transcriptional regulator with XRE-family HTH domain
MIGSLGHVRETTKIMKKRTKRDTRVQKANGDVPAQGPRVSSASGMAHQGIGARIRFLRRQRNMTLEQLSNCSKLTKSFVSKVERGVSVPSISTAMKLAESFQITVSQLLGEDHYDDGVSLVRKNERRAFMRSGSSSGYNYEMIAGSKRFKRMEPYIMRPPLEFQDDRLFEHVGEELMFVLSGCVEVELSRQSFRLNPGDALYFDSHLPHRSRSLRNKYAEVLVVVTGG